MSGTTGDAGQEPSIFVSYRHADAAKDVENLKQSILTLRDDVSVFIDRDPSDGVVGGEIWPERLERELAQSRLVLVVIGPLWLHAVDEWSRRLIDRDEDWCRKEVDHALANRKELLPIIVRGAKLPPSHALPESIRELDLRQAVTLTSEDWGEFFKRLRAALDRVFGPAPGTAAVRVAAEVKLNVVAKYRHWLETAHNRETWSLPGVRRQFIEDVFVAIDVGVARRSQSGEDAAEDAALRGGLGSARVSLRDLMSGARPELAAPAWTVLGEPGAGKTTLARHLTLELGETAGEGVLPVYLPLPLVAGEGGDVSVLFRVTQESAGVDGLAALLEKRATDTGEQPVWFLLDGLDEVAPARLGKLRTCLAAWAGQLANARIAVFSRTIGFQELGGPFRTAAIQPLSPESRRRLVAHWADPQQCEDLLAHLDSHPAVGRLAGNPLMLTLMAQLAADGKDGKAFPRNRIDLYDEAIELLIERPQSEADGAQIRARSQVREVLAGLCLELQSDAGSSWTVKVLIAALRRAEDDNEHIRQTIAEVWDGDRDAFLDDVAKKTGLIEPDPTKRKVWSFAHRQFREFLAAEALASAAKGWKAIVGEVRADDVPRWSETLGLLCGMTDHPMEVLDLLRERSIPAFVKALPDVEGVEPATLATLLWDQEPRIDGWRWSEGNESPYHWDGDHLAECVQAWVEQGRWSKDAAAEWLWRRVAPDASTMRLAWLHWTLAKLERGENERFFVACRRPRQPAALKWVAIEGGSFTQGSPETEAERTEAEGPTRVVTVAGYELSKYAVTNGQYRLFAPKHEVELFGKLDAADAMAHPVVNVSWWEGYLYCAWVGGRLPTESEWEYACRAGSTGPFSFDGPLTTDKVNFDGNYPYEGSPKGEYRERTVEVGELPGNGWGLHEMHGNVREWCEDRWHESYEGAPIDGRAWLDGGERMRVVRGGSWDSDGRFCRSAYRYRFAPGDADRFVGFRPARSSH